MSSTRMMIVISGLVYGLVATWSASVALARQSPLGDGTGLQKSNQGLQRGSNGLQRDLQVPGTGTPAPGTTRDFAAEVRFRNSIVTGNVGGGAAFRGKVGYTDSMDFRGKLGSDDLFAFKRDSLFSGAAGMGVRGTDALQYQFALSTGNSASAPSSLAGSSLMLGRGTAELAFNTTNANTAELRRSDANQVSGAIRSSSAYAAQRSLRPSFVGFRSPATGEYERLVASPTYGLQFQPWDATPFAEAPAADTGTNSATTQRLLSTPFSRTVDRLASSPMANRPVSATPADPAAAPVAPAATGSTANESLSALQQRLFGLRQSLTGSIENGKSGTADPGIIKLSEEELKSLRATDKATSLVERADMAVPLPAVADQYLQHMTKGQELVKAGRYFDAEERFALALAAHPGDLPALVGRLHAQIAGGLTVSAAANLRNILAEHPEAVGITYSDDLLGGADRAATVRQSLRGNIEANRIPGESGLILAYLGYQQGDAGQPDVVTGLDAVSAWIRKRASLQQNTQADEALLELVRGVWRK
ncbi:MAG: hypothetical protein KGS45_03455 [Planctomycetes bacterium]|nr:hypothetical protein [Planctomycetota bacterium]